MKIQLVLYQAAICLWLVFSPWPASGAAILVDGNRIMDQSMPENLCALTFDDGPSPYTPHLLDMLAEYEIPATFFVLGSQVAQHPRMVERIRDMGHEIGNHSWSHANLKSLGAERQREEIGQTDALLKRHGITPLYMRPPYGAYDERTIKIAEEMGISVILWSLDSYDWKHLPGDYAKLRSTRGTVYDEGALRGIFLFHDIHRNTVEDLPRIIANLKAGGCEKFVTVSEYLTGIADPEPPLLMTRHPAPEPLPDQPMYAAGHARVPLARCAKPWNMQIPAQPLEAAHAQAPVPPEGL